MAAARLSAFASRGCAPRTPSLKDFSDYQIALLIYLLIAGVLCFVLIGFQLIPLLVIMHLLCGIIGAVRASDGQAYRYPFTRRFL